VHLYILSAYLKKGFLIFLFINLFGCEQHSSRSYSRYSFPNILNIKNIPHQSQDSAAHCFFDQGAWFGFALVPDTAKNLYGGFVGPFLLNKWRWLSKNLIQLTLENAQTKQKFDFLQSQLVENSFYPGLLVHKLENDLIDVKLQLCFSSPELALVRIDIQNNAGTNLALKLGFRGEIFAEVGTFEYDGEGLLVHLKHSDDVISLLPFSDSNFQHHISEKRDHYCLQRNQNIKLKPGNTFSTYVEIYYSKSSKEASKKSREYVSSLDHIQGIFHKNELRWNRYINKILQTESLWADDPAYQRIAIKALLTLINNWKAPTGALYHCGLIPSYNIHYFNGFWAWDSWKHAAALAQFAPGLAKDQIRAMFDYQDQSGMIADCIFVDPNENNWRDSKPPLAAWAVWEVFEATNDVLFLEELYPKMKKYHYWWFKFRDHDQNGLCEYGSTDGTLVAARWESGMDNAVRFDDAEMLFNHDMAWSMDQESVDLNSYLFAEKKWLAFIAKRLALEDEVTDFEKEADELKRKIRTKMFDNKSGYFYDLKLTTGRFEKVRGPEGWIPLWSGVATGEQAERVRQIMVDSTEFATYVPFPTVSRNHPEFSLGYWRGPVWLDQAYFAIKGLQRYGYYEDADRFTRQLFNRLEGLKNSNLPIRENYNPLTGEGLNVSHFSWSAAHLLLLFMGK